MSNDKGSQSRKPEACKDSVQEQLFKALSKKDLDEAKRIIRQEPRLNLNCVDQDELSPLQHACHIGDLELARLIINNGGDVNYTQRKDKYTALMFAAISAKADIVRLLMERDVDTAALNCVNRTAADMAAFVSQTRIVSIINCWIPYASSVEPYTRRRELEDTPRIPSKHLGRLLHDYITYPTYHPAKFMLFIKEHPLMIKHGREFIYVLDDLCAKTARPPITDDTLSMKYHYISYILQYCLKEVELKKLETCISDDGDSFDGQECEKIIENVIKRLIRKDDPELDIPNQVQRLILEGILKYPYTQSAIFKTATFALSKLGKIDIASISAYLILVQILNGPRVFGAMPEACAVCRDDGLTKKCSRCKSAFYCDQSCQKVDWFQHKKHCKSDK